MFPRVRVGGLWRAGRGDGDPDGASESLKFPPRSPDTSPVQSGGEMTDLPSAWEFVGNAQVHVPCAAFSQQSG